MTGSPAAGARVALAPLLSLWLGCAGEAASNEGDAASNERDAATSDASLGDGGAVAPCDFDDPELTPAPDSFPPPYALAQNPTTRAGAALGRRLFYDPALSTNGEVSCATCHEPAHAFSVPDALSTRGVSGQPLPRHAPVLFNLAWARSGLFWDGGAKNLESQALAPLTQRDEMGHQLGLNALIASMGAEPSYVAHFEHAFGPGGLSSSNLLRALAQFQRTIVSDQSRWDQRERGEIAFTAEEQAGEAVYTEHCARCHSAGLFTDDGYHNNGLDAEFGENPLDVSRGRARVSQSEEDLGKFKTPSLRNVALSAPYMHDGRFATLDEVIQHYRRGILSSPSLDPGFVGADGALGVVLTDVEADALEAFLEALTDPGLGERFGPLREPDCPPESKEGS